MRSFHFRGQIPASKSILNRLLILQSYPSNLTIDGDSDCDDVRDLKNGLLALDAGRMADAGSGGTTFRFLVLRASRLTGGFEIKASPRLLARPQNELSEILSQLGVHIEFHADGCTVEGHGWQKPNGPLKLSLARSSQFASGVLLNAWDLPFDLELQFKGDAVSNGYLEMTRDLVRSAGLKIETRDDHWKIPHGQIITATKMLADADVSSAFSIAALGALGGSAEILNFPLEATLSPQPDRVFVSILEKMGAHCEQRSANLKITRANVLAAVDVDLKNSPDLFPVLATLCAFADGRSVLQGAPQLAFKESSRILKTAELVEKLRRRVEQRPDGLIIYGRAEGTNASFDFDPDHDHRLAMAAGLAQIAGADIRVTTPAVVTKSYPDFWRVLQAGLR